MYVSLTADTDMFWLCAEAAEENTNGEVVLTHNYNKLLFYSGSKVFTTHAGRGWQIFSPKV